MQQFDYKFILYSNKLMKIAQKYCIEGRNIVEDNLISEGAYGYIFKAHDQQSSQIFALKKMFCQVNYHSLQKGQERTAVAQNELSILRKLPKHPNIVGFYGGQLARNEQGVNQALMLMEFCSGGSLFDLMAKNPNTRFSESQILSIMRDVVQGLKAMHSLKPSLAHRDIKIENILCQDGKFKLCDFGSSSEQRVNFNLIDKKDFSIYEEEYEKNTTLMYRPPEMADLYQRYEVTEKVDIWMIGCVIFTLCFFIHPFQECSKLAIVNASYNFPKPSNYSEKLHDLIRIMLTPNPKLRPSIFEIDQILQDFSQLKQIQLNNQAQEIKNREKILEKEMEIYQQNAEKVKHFDGDIPLDELIKLQQKIKQDQVVTKKQPLKQSQPLIQNENFFHKASNSDNNQVTKNDIWGGFDQFQTEITKKQSPFDNNWGFHSQPQQINTQSQQNSFQDLNWGNQPNNTAKVIPQQSQLNTWNSGFTLATNNDNNRNQSHQLIANIQTSNNESNQIKSFDQNANQLQQVNLYDLISIQPQHQIYPDLISQHSDPASSNQFNQLNSIASTKIDLTDIIL